jgi:hypothetical protein
VHSCYSSSDSSSAGAAYGQLMRAGVKAAGPDVVSSTRGRLATNTCDCYDYHSRGVHDAT